MLLSTLVSSASGAEGTEAPSIAMDLENTNWQLVHMTVLGGYEFIPEEPGKYVLNFRSDSRLTGSSDCNEIGGLWIQEDFSLSFKPFVSSRKLCAPGSLHNNFALYLRDTAAFALEDDNLVLTTSTEGIRLEFEPR